MDITDLNTSLKILQVAITKTNIDNATLISIIYEKLDNVILFYLSE